MIINCNTFPDLTRGPDKRFESLFYRQEIVERFEALEGLIKKRVASGELAAEFVHLVQLLGESGEPLLPVNSKIQRLGEFCFYIGAQSKLLRGYRLRVRVEMMLITRAQVEQADRIESLQDFWIAHTRR